MKRDVFNDDHEAFRSTVRRFIEAEVVPDFPTWSEQGFVPREFYHKLAGLGLLGLSIPEEYGGAGATSFKFQAILLEEAARAGVNLGTTGLLNVIYPYLDQICSDEQKKRWFPGLASGDIRLSLAMTEPGTGSDLAGIRTRAVLDGDEWVINGAKTFITGGVMADLVLVVCRTETVGSGDDRRGGLSIIAVETNRDGFVVGRRLEKIGMRSSDTAELSFTDVRVPVDNRLGEEGRAFKYLARNLPHERLTIAVTATGQAAAAIGFAKAYTQEREVFGQPVAAFQNTKFVLAECAAEVEAAQAMVDRAMDLHDAGELSAADAAKAKLFCTEVCARVVDKCLQLHGGYGYMLEYPIARLYADIRASRVYGGSNEIMKTIIAKDMGL